MKAPQELPDRLSPQLLKKLQMFKIRSRRSFLGTRQGGHISLKKGHGIEFSDYRRYAIGDNPRHIDWGVYGRTEKLYVRRYQEEQDLPFMLVLDKTPSMLNPKSEEKWSYARDVALSLSYVAFLQHDQVRVALPGSIAGQAYRSPRSVYTMYKLLESAKSPSPEEFFRGVPESLQGFRFPGVAILISDFLYPLKQVERLVSAFRAKNLDSSFLQILGPLDRGVFPDQESHLLVDSERGTELQLSFGRSIQDEYKHLLDQHLGAIRAMCYSSGIRFLSLNTQDSLEDSLLRELSSSGLVQT